METVNLCQELVKAMEKHGFSEGSMNTIKQSSHFIDAYDKGQDVQRTMLTMLLFNILMYKQEPVPRDIRIALNVATTALAWFDDVNTVILPFMKANEAVFFP